MTLPSPKGIYLMGIEETLVQKLSDTIRALDEFKTEFNDLKKILFGNGAIGLDEQIRKNTKVRQIIERERVIEQVAENSKMRKSITKFIWIVVGVFVAQTAGFIFFLLSGAGH